MRVCVSAHMVSNAVPPGFLPTQTNTVHANLTLDSLLFHSTSKSLIPASPTLHTHTHTHFVLHVCLFASFTDSPPLSGLMMSLLPHKNKQRGKTHLLLHLLHLDSQSKLIQDQIPIGHVNTAKCEASKVRSVGYTH